MNAAERFRRRHVSGDPFLLPNAWDLPSARMLEGSGFEFIGTTSLGVAAVAGKPDGTGSTRAETIDLARSLAQLGVGVTVDIEAGFDDDPAVVADLVAELASFGILGVNIEDGRSDGMLAPVELQVQKVEAIRRAAPELFINARTDPYWLKQDDDSFNVARERALRYCEAGADGVFVPGVSEPGVIADLVEAVPAPLNILYQPGGPTVPDLARLGIARVSCGSLLFRGALAAIEALAADIRFGRDVSGAGIPSYSAVLSG